MVDGSGPSQRLNRRSVLATLGTTGIGSLAGCGSILGGKRVLWDEEGWGSVFATGETFTFRSLSTEDVPTTLRAHEPSDGSVVAERDVDASYHFVSDGSWLYATNDSELVALDGELSEQWRTRADGDLWGLAIGGDTVARIDHGGVLTAFDRDSGDTKWHRDILHERTLSNIVWFSLRVDDAGVVVFSTREDDERLRRLAFTHGGDLRWDERSGDFRSKSVTTALADDIVVASLDERLLGFDRSNGERMWTKDLDDDLSYLTVASGLVYGELDDTIVAHDVATGDRQWADTPGVGDTSIQTSPVVAADERGAVLSAGGETWAYDHDGNQRWHVGEAGGGSVALREDTVGVADGDALTAIRRG